MSAPAHYLFSLFPRPPKSTLFPYTTLFRSQPRSRISWSRSIPSSATFRTGCKCCSTARRMTAAVEQHLQPRSEEHTSELQSRQYLVCRLLLEKKKRDNRRGHGADAFGVGRD